MLLSALDPAVLIYRHTEWQAKDAQCLRRFAALGLHRRMTREYGQKIAMSNAMASLILQHFPWSSDYRQISELRDLRAFILLDLQRAHYVETMASGVAEIQPMGVLCRDLQVAEVADVWTDLLCGCVSGAVSEEFDTQIATWGTEALRNSNGFLTLRITIRGSVGASEAHRIPLVWDYDTWVAQLAAQDWWPDLHRCVELCFAASPDMRRYGAARERPLEFDCTPAFMRSVDRYGEEDESVRRSLIKALTKIVYGIRDPGLADERFRNVRRFRVTSDFRVHYSDEHGVLVLLEFGHHDIGCG